MAPSSIHGWPRAGRQVACSRRAVPPCALAGNGADLRDDPRASVPAWAHRRLAPSRGLPILRGAGRALPARLRPRARPGRGPRPARGLDHHVHRARGRRAQGGEDAARVLLQGVRALPRGRLGHAARPHQPGLYLVPAGHRAGGALPRVGRRAPALLLDLLGGGQEPRARGLARSALFALDRHLRLRGVRRGGPRRARVHRRAGRGPARPRAREHAAALRHHQPLRVDVLGYGLAPGDMAQSLPGYLDEIKRSKPEDLVVVSRELDPAYEITTLVVKLEREGRRRPVLICERVRGTQFPVLTNLHASRARLALAMGAAPEDMLATYLRAMDRPILPRVVASGPCQDVVLTGDRINLYDLPQLLHHEGDAGAYLTSAISFAKDPSSETWNCAYNRLMIQGRDRTSIHLTAGKHLWQFQRIAESLGPPLPAAFAIGFHPAIALGAPPIRSLAEDER